ncbi:hypothetical protein CARUB_v10005906mg [Capsella rubella]|uniref:FLZ-type domain-containing protein n=1 Tax=Capsella rubella TaxID=81985 RepID=R0F6U8_9BRAS|nr:uncharacterized protein LOC17880838 [Capsella rubella]EOA17547.1 hypothetical protein CARUB_v10005906mg [Capsella rubella]
MEVSTRKPYFIDEEEEGGLASLEAGVSTPSCYNNNLKKMNHHYNHPQSYYYHHHHHQYSVSSPRSGKFHDFRFDNSSFGQPHFLDSCFLCKKRLGDNRDIFMYRGDTPFCSEECREEQIERDEAKEKKQSLSSSVKAMRRNEKRSSSSSPTISRDYAFHSGTVAAA